jgi:hypothetical protein
MEISRERSEKLRRYFVNADPFLWGVLEKRNKKERLQELKKNGYLTNYSEGSNPTYSKVNQDLLVELGIEGILKCIVVTRVINRFNPEVISYFRRCWEQGQLPELKYLKEHKLYQTHIFSYDRTVEGWTNPRVVGHKDLAHVFVQIDTQHEFVERWTVFAGLWFEEIEPLNISVSENTNKNSAEGNY